MTERPVEVHDDPEPRPVDVDDDPDVPVEGLLLVVVPDLHDLVADAELAGPPLEPLLERVEPLLELQVQVVDAAKALVHRADDLDLGREGGDAEPARDPRLAEADDGLEGLALVVLPDEVEIRFLRPFRRIDEPLALVDRGGR